jgi:hypothetical protein
MAEHGDNNGFDNGFEKVPTADELRSGASFVQDVVHGPPPASSATASDSGAGGELKTSACRAAIFKCLLFDVPGHI